MKIVIFVTFSEIVPVNHCTLCLVLCVRSIIKMMMMMMMILDFFFLKKRDEYFCWVGGLGKDGGQGYRMEYHR